MSAPKDCRSRIWSDVSQIMFDYWENFAMAHFTKHLRVGEVYVAQ